MRQLNNTELNAVNGAWGIPTNIAAYLPAMPAINMPALPAAVTAHPYVAAIATLGVLIAGTIGYQYFRSEQA